MRRIALAIRLLGFIAIPQGCAATDPLLNLSDWHPTGANEMNIAAQVANPADLIRGRAATGGSDGGLSAAAILRLRTDHVKKLPDSAITDLQVQSAPASASAP